MDDDGLAAGDIGTDGNRSDVGNARRLVAAFGGRVRHVGPWNTWLIWDGRRWKADTKGQIVEHAKEVARLMWHQAIDMPAGTPRTQALAWAAKTEGAGRIEAMIRMARSDPCVAIDPQQLDADPWVLNLRNGTLNLRSGELTAHNPSQLLTKVAPVDHEPGVPAVRWQKFLAQIIPDPDVRLFLQRWVGYCLSGVVTEHKIVFAFGSGANGKSTLLNTIEHVMGDYARQSPPDLLMKRRDDPHPTGLADLQGARLVLGSETAQGRHLDEALVKRLTGGDPIKARKMFNDFFEFQPSHKLVVATNHRPAVDGTDHGIWRRIRLVPFAVKIPDEDQDLLLEAKLLDEAAGILDWAVRGCLDWQLHGLTEPAAITSATAEYRSDMDILGEFISDSCILADTITARAADLYKSYERWCEAMGEQAKSQRVFGLALSERGLTKRRSNGIWWHGIGLQVEPSSNGYPDETAGRNRYDPGHGTIGPLF